MRRSEALALLLVVSACSKADSNVVTLLNASFDPTREMYEELNGAFVAQWAKKTGQTVVVNQSHGGSGKQARAVIDGLEADVVTLALPYDVDAIATKGKLLSPDWAARLPHASVPFTSTVVFVVRKGNPKAIRDWEDLARPGVQVITPNPKTSGGARWNYLAAWGFAERKGLDARALLKGIYANVPVLDSGARSATTTFAERELGDVLVTWESDAKLIAGRGFELVVPSVSVLAETPVAVVDANVDRHGTRAVAEAYVQFLFTDEAGAIAEKHGFHKRGESVPENLFRVSDWQKEQQTHFAAQGVFDQLQEATK